jgi:hypothetical protein
LKSKAPKGEQWLHEIKFDGYRIQVHINRGRKKVFTRNGLDWTKRFSVIAGAFDIPGEAILDGEVVVTHEGRTNFSVLQAELAAGRQDRLVYYAFDLLWRNQPSSPTSNIAISPLKAFCGQARLRGCHGDRSGKSAITDPWRVIFSGALAPLPVAGLFRLMPETDADRFRQEAEECRQQSHKAVSQLDKEAWLRLAADWIKMAENAEQRRPNWSRE